MDSNFSHTVSQLLDWTTNLMLKLQWTDEMDNLFQISKEMLSKATKPNSLQKMVKPKPKSLQKMVFCIIEIGYGFQATAKFDMSSWLLPIMDLVDIPIWRIRQRSSRLILFGKIWIEIFKIWSKTASYANAPKGQYPRSSIMESKYHGEHEKSTGRNQVLHFDYYYVGESSTGSQYLLILRDGFSRFIMLFDFAEADSANAVEAILQWISLFGIPKQFFSDNGSHFSSSMAWSVKACGSLDEEEYFAAATMSLIRYEDRS